MYIARVFFMAAPKPKVWVCKFDTLGEALAACKEKYRDPAAQGWLVKDENGNVIEKRGVAL